MSQPTLTVTEDFTENFKKIIDSFRHDEVVVGIPSEDNGRKKKDAPIGNAALLALNEFGSPQNNIPARHPMQTGIKLAKDAIAEEFKKAAKNSLKKGVSALAEYYERAGIIAANSIKKVINDQTDMEPPSESTLESRKARGFKGTKALVVTGQMRNVITSVVRRKI